MKKLDRHNEIINSLCKQHKVKLCDLKQNPDAFYWYVGEKQYLKNYGAVWPRSKELHIGKFANLDARLIVFLHELGHLILLQNNLDYDPVFTAPDIVYRHEEQAWKYAFKLLKQHGVSPTKKMRYMYRISIKGYKIKMQAASLNTKGRIQNATSKR